MTSVIIYNRHGYEDRFGAHVIELSDDATSWTTCFTGTLPSTYGPHSEACSGRAQHVRLRKTQAGTINLAEVLVAADETLTMNTPRPAPSALVIVLQYSYI